MTTSTVRRFAATGAVALLVLAACSTNSDSDSGSGAAKTNGSAVAAAKARREWLFAIQSDGPSSYDAATATLAMPTGTVNAFTDRPYRDTRAISPFSFADLWNDRDPDSFAKDPPNAVLTYWDDEAATGTPQSVVCEITGDVQYAATDDVLSMGLRVLEPNGATLPSRLFNASLFVDDVTSNCTNSPDDEMIVEYFNEINFEQDIVITIPGTNQGSGRSITVQCPESPSPTFPGPDFELQLATADESATTTCRDQQPIDVPTSPTPTYCQGNRCTFVMTLLNRTTGTVYSETILTLDLSQPTAQTIMPDLNAATLPICNNTLNPCLLDGSCQENPGQSPIQLCESGTDCSRPGG